ncbi:cysteine desulfurase family protein [Lactobacillus xylocopicola]|uniref:Cysteine desulfurase n=1 Tax=Lactobacillus xylocopicola TaxID=2976676 RepID=A0ABM8BGL1_9LACO|nr:cysteine desulfurase family protein [Lactobacillus xylocopicola]BDR60411.1 cysteine desulfurase [Lactobacillus xylocopicola]
MAEVYLDNAATTPLAPAVIDVITEEMKKTFGNASSTYELGRKARRVIDQARGQVAAAINAKENEIIFTSGGSESNNTAIFGTAQARRAEGRRIITTKIEHPSVLEPMKQLERAGYDVIYLDVDDHGRIALSDLKQALTPATILVSIMAVNNEVGTINPLTEIGALVADSNAYFHVDAVQALGNLDLDVAKMKIDLLSASAHKINGPKFLGFLYEHHGVKLPPLVLGGEQETKRRAGTENVPGIAGFGEAISESAALDKQKLQAKYQGFQKLILDKLTAGKIDFEINGGTGTHDSHHLLNLHLVGVSTTLLQANLDLAGFAVSGGSACTAGSLEPSHVLLACFGKDSPRINESIRISFGRFTTAEEVTAFAQQLVKIAGKIQQKGK